MHSNSLTPSVTLVVSAKQAAKDQVFDTKAIQQLDSAHYLHPFTDFKDLNSKGARVMVRGEGIYIWDSEGKKVPIGLTNR